MTAFLLILLLAVGCGNGNTPLPLDATVPRETLEAFSCEPPVDGMVEAVIVAQRAIETTRLMPTEPPSVHAVERVTYTQAMAQTGREDEEMDTRFALEGEVWIVIFEGDWEIVPPGPATTPQPAEERCVFAIIDPEDCRAFQIGTMTCP